MPAQQRPEFCLCLRIKNLNLLILGSCDLGAVGGECHAANRVVDGQCRLAFKSASRAYCPYLYCFIVAAGGKLGAVVVP